MPCKKMWRIYHPKDGYVSKEFKKKTTAIKYKTKHDLRGSIVKRRKK